MRCCTSPVPRPAPATRPRFPCAPVRSLVPKRPLPKILVSPVRSRASPSHSGSGCRCKSATSCWAPRRLRGRIGVAFASERSWSQYAPHGYACNRVSGVDPDPWRTAARMSLRSGASMPCATGGCTACSMGPAPSPSARTCAFCAYRRGHKRWRCASRRARILSLLRRWGSNKA